MTGTRVSPQTAPRTAVVWQVIAGELARQHGRQLTVIDVGGGTGGFAVPLAEAGHTVTVIDPSPDALAALARRAAEAGVADRISPRQGDGDRLAELVPAGSVDLVLCHSMLEVVDDPPQVLRQVATVLRPGGAVSVLVANRAGAVLGRAMSGQFGAAGLLLADSRESASTADLHRRSYDEDTAVALLASAGLRVEQTHGVRVLVDLVPAAVADSDPDGLLGLETRLCGEAPFRDIAAQLHLFARRVAE